MQNYKIELFSFFEKKENFYIYYFGENVMYYK